MMRYSALQIIALASYTWAAPSLSESPPMDHTLIVQMFTWNWDSIAAECTEFLGPAGYGFVSVSPPQESVQSASLARAIRQDLPWWTDYQPTSYNLTSKHGNRTQFANMINTCHTAGVKVIVDTVLNHMSAAPRGTGTAGTEFTIYNYPGIYSYDDFHHCGLEPGDDLVDSTSLQELWNCELVGLPDLATEKEHVRARLAAYVNDLMSLGVDGLRLDAAKHIPPEDLANIFSRIAAKPYITQEVTRGEGHPVGPLNYTGIGDVQEFQYATSLRDAFLTGNISSLRDIPRGGWLSAHEANVFVANHDTERSGNSLNYSSPDNTYINAHIFSLAYSYGRPTVLSSFAYDEYDAAPPNLGVGTCSGSAGSNGWICQHRWTAIAGMVGFRNHVGNAPVINWTSPHPNRIAFGRGTAGFVAINNGDKPWIANFKTRLAPGTYCNVVSGAHTDRGVCSGSSHTVAALGILSAVVPARAAIAVHVGQEIVSR